MGRQAVGTRMVIREAFFVNPDASFSAPYPNSRVWKKQIVCVKGSCDLQTTTRYLNKAGLGTWDHFLMAVKLDGREMRLRKRRKG